MSEQLSVTTAARNFAEYVNRVAYRRESFVLVRGGKRVAELRPTAQGVRLADLPALIASVPHLDDTDDFAAQIDSARKELDAVEQVNPWGS